MYQCGGTPKYLFADLTVFTLRSLMWCGLSHSKVYIYIRVLKVTYIKKTTNRSYDGHVLRSCSMERFCYGSPPCKKKGGKPGQRLEPYYGVITYIDSILIAVSQARVGCFINDNFVEALAFSDVSLSEWTRSRAA